MEKSVYIVCFEYDSGVTKGKECCIVRANSKEEAKEVFEKIIYKVFFHTDDVCTIINIIDTEDDDLIYIDRGHFWHTSMKKNPSILDLFKAL